MGLTTLHARAQPRPLNHTINPSKRPIGKNVRRFHAPPPCHGSPKKSQKSPSWQKPPDRHHHTRKPLTEPIISEPGSAIASSARANLKECLKNLKYLRDERQWTSRYRHRRRSTNIDSDGDGDVITRDPDTVEWESFSAHHTLSMANSSQRMTCKKPSKKKKKRRGRGG